MKYGKNDIYQIIDLYNYYLSSEYSYEGKIELTPDGYCTIGVKFHRWCISSICIGSHTFSCIKLSDVAIGDILVALKSMSLQQAFELNKDIIKISLQ